MLMAKRSSEFIFCIGWGKMIFVTSSHDTRSPFLLTVAWRQSQEQYGTIQAF